MGLVAWLPALAGAHTSLIGFGLRQHIQAKGSLETRESQDATDVALVKAIGTPSKSDCGS